jgi:hypothetical protein
VTRVRRLAVGAVLVLALVSATFAGRASTHRPPVPPALVGVWKGGSHSNGPWYYEFSADGGYRARPAEGPGAETAGTVEVEGASITFSNGGAPVTSTWSVSNGLLLLDGQTYARA